MSKTTKNIASAIKDASKSKTSGYDTQAVVKRIEGNTAWVHIPGGVDETPVQMTMAAKPGDAVQVRVSNGRAWLQGNATAPPTDDTRANFAVGAAIDAGKEAGRAKDAADRAEASAEEARTQAVRATGYANDSLSQLSIVEDVVGTLNWITTHATYKLTGDEKVKAGKWYFTKSGDTYNVVINPTGDPSAQGWYEIDSIDEAVSNYVASHLALTNAGLWVTKDNQSYKILLANDSMKVYDDTGRVVASYGSEARIGKLDANNNNIVVNPSNIVFRSGTKQFGQISAYDSTTLGTTMQNLELASKPSAKSYGRITLSASSASGVGIPSEADLVAKKGSAEAGVYVTADQDSGGGHADVIILGKNIALQVGYGDDYIGVIGRGSSTVATLDPLGNMALEGYLTVGGYRAIDRNYICYANSRVDNFTNGQITLSLSALGITTGAKPVGILLTYQDGGATPTILRYDYDASSASGVVIKAYNSSGAAVSGSVRYFAVVFQNSWTSAT